MRQILKRLSLRRGLTLMTTKVKQELNYWTCTHKDMRLDGPDKMYCPKCNSKFKIYEPVHRL